MPKKKPDVWSSSLLSRLLVLLKTYFRSYDSHHRSNSEEAPTNPTKISQIAYLPRNTDPTHSGLLVSMNHPLVSTELRGLHFTLQTEGSMGVAFGVLCQGKVDGP